MVNAQFSPSMLTFWAAFEDIHTAVVSFWATFGNFWATSVTRPIPFVAAYMIFWSLTLST